MNLGAGAEYDLGHNMKGYAGIFFNNGFLPDATKPNNYKLGTYGNLPFTDGNVRLNSFSLRIGIYF